MENEELISLALSGRWNEEQKELFRQRLETDEAFRAEWEEAQNVRMAITIMEEEGLRKELQGIEDQYGQSNRGMFKWIWLGFLVLVVVLFLYTFLQSDTSASDEPEDIYATYFEPYPNALAPASRGDEGTNGLDSILMLYDNSQYVASENGFKELWSADSLLEYRFYYAMSLLNQDKTSAALNELSNMETMDFKFGGQVLWYSALLYCKMEDYNRAGGKLHELSAMETTYKAKESEEILEWISGQNNAE